MVCSPYTQWLDLRALTPKLLRCATTRIKIRYSRASTAFEVLPRPRFASGYSSYFCVRVLARGLMKQNDSSVATPCTDTSHHRKTSCGRPGAKGLEMSGQKRACYAAAAARTQQQRAATTRINHKNSACHE